MFSFIDRRARVIVLEMSPPGARSASSLFRSASMTLKHMLGLVLLGLAIPGVCAATTASRRLRVLAFLVMMAGWVVTDRMDIHFFSFDLYRGSTRGVEISILDILGLGVLTGELLNPGPGRRRWFWPASLGFMLFYFFYCCFSVAISSPRMFGIFELSKILRGIFVFVLASWFIRGERELRLLVLGLACAVGFEGLLSVKERVLGHVDRVTGTLNHPNSLSMYLCMVTPVLLAAATSRFPRFIRHVSTLCVGLATLAELLTFSRAGIPIFAFVALGTTAACVSLRLTLKKAAIGFLVCVASAALFLKLWGAIKERYHEATWQEEIAADQFENRGQYFHLAGLILRDHFFGVGLNNWSYWVSKQYGREIGIDAYRDYDDIPAYILASNGNWDDTYAPPAHNLGVITAGELGLLGLGVFALLWLRWFQMGFVFLWKRSDDPMRRMGVGLFFATCGIFLQSVTEWVFRATPMFMTFHVLMGALASLYFVRRHGGRGAWERPIVAAAWKARDRAAPYGLPTGG